MEEQASTQVFMEEGPNSKVFWGEEGPIICYGKGTDKLVRHDSEAGLVLHESQMFYWKKYYLKNYPLQNYFTHSETCLKSWGVKKY